MADRIELFTQREVCDLIELAGYRQVDYGCRRWRNRYGRTCGEPRMGEKLVWEALKGLSDEGLVNAAGVVEAIMRADPPLASGLGVGRIAASRGKEWANGMACGLTVGWELLARAVLVVLGRDRALSPEDLESCHKATF